MKRKIAGLKGRKNGKTWEFTYPTDTYPLLLTMKKDNVWKQWQAHFGDEKVGSGQTMKEALEQATRRMENMGYQLAQ